jgi:hypothetical protein
MTEADWLVCTNPDDMLYFLQGGASDRKLRLFAVACCRRIWPLMTDPGSRSLVEAAERHIDGWATEDEWKAASAAAHEAWVESSALCVPWLYGRPQRPMTAEEVAAAHVLHATTSAAWAIGPGSINAIPGHWGRAVAHEAARETARAVNENYPTSRERPVQCDLLRCIFGPLPFRAVHIDQSWLAWNGGVVKKLATAVYQERSLPDGTLDLARLAVLADALEEAGCAEAELLAHLRSPGPHVRGCFALDLLLSRE